VFELSYGHPQLGVGRTTAILVVSGPGTVLSLWMAIAWNNRSS